MLKEFSSEPEISTSLLGTKCVLGNAALQLAWFSKQPLSHFAAWDMLSSESVDEDSLDSKWTIGGWPMSTAEIVNHMCEGAVQA